MYLHFLGNVIVNIGSPTESESKGNLPELLVYLVGLSLLGRVLNSPRPPPSLSPLLSPWLALPYPAGGEAALGPVLSPPCLQLPQELFWAHD